MIDSAKTINFEPYLQSVLNDEDYLEWNEVYTATTVERHKQSQKKKFSRRLKLWAETVEPQADRDDGSQKASAEQEQVEHWDVLMGLREYAPDHVLLIGKPGSGKSTSLERLLWEEAGNALQKNPEAKIPVLIKLRRCTSTIENLIQSFFSCHQLPLEITDIEYLLRQGKLLLLLDGLNELPDTLRTEVANFRDRYRKIIPMVVSTRDLSIGGTLGITKTLKMLPLTEPQMQEFVRGYLGEEGNRLFQQLKGNRLQKFAETPLLLWMLCRVFVENSNVPANLGLALREFTQLYDQQIQADTPAESRDQWPKLLRHLAFAMMHDKNPVEFRLSTPREDAETLLADYLQQEGRAKARESAERWLQDLLDYHLLQTVRQPNFEEHIEFSHQLIQEYYAAEYLLRLLPELTDGQLTQDYLNFLKWTESIALMLALADEESQQNETQTLRVVQLALDVDLRLGARLAGEAVLAFQEATVRKVIALSVPDWLKIELLGTTQSKMASSELASFLTHPDIHLSEVAASYIGETDNQEVIDLLKARLDEFSDNFFSQSSWCGPDRNGILWTKHVQALSHVSPQLTIHFLREKIENHGTVIFIATSAVPILMHLDARTIIPEILQEFQDIQSRKSKNIVFSNEENHTIELINPGSNHEVSIMNEEPKAINFIKRPSTELLRKNHILNLLENSSDYNLFIPNLIDLFHKESEFHIKKHIIKILGKSKHVAAIYLLIQILGNDIELRSETANQLIKLESINNPTNLNELRKLAAHKNWDISWCAAFVLGHLKDSTILPRIIDEMTNNYSSHIRSRAAEILGLLGDASCISALVKALESDADNNVRVSAALALSHFRHQEAMPLLLKLVEKSTSVTPKVIKSLSRLGMKEPLIRIIKDKESQGLHWQTAAIELGKIAQPESDDAREVLPELCHALVDPGYASSNEIIRLISKLIEPEILNELIGALENPDQHTKDPYLSNRAALVLERCSAETMAPKLISLKQLEKKKYIEQLSWLIPSIQNRSKIYNYEIWQEVIENIQLAPREKEQSDTTRPAIFNTFNIKNLQIDGSANLGGIIDGDQIGAQNN